jgi:hypothetical protein
MPIPTDSGLAERRKFPRRAVSEVVRLELYDGAPASPPGLLVTDVSDGGVRLFAQNVDIPARFALVFAESGVRRECRKVWRIGDEIGVEFVGSVSSKTGGNGRRPSL